MPPIMPQDIKNQTSQEFYTLKGYALLENNAITPSMEDYLEMIYRIHTQGDIVRIGILAEKLNVKPSSATKMVDNLKKSGLVAAEKYAYVKLTDAGHALGAYLILRHDTIHQLLCFINGSSNELAQVEKIEHFINPHTVHNIQLFLQGVSASAT